MFVKPRAVSSSVAWTCKLIITTATLTTFYIDEIQRLSLDDQHGLVSTYGVKGISVKDAPWNYIMFDKCRKIKTELRL